MHSSSQSPAGWCARDTHRPRNQRSTPATIKYTSARPVRTVGARSGAPIASAISVIDTPPASICIADVTGPLGNGRRRLRSEPRAQQIGASPITHAGPSRVCNAPPTWSNATPAKPTKSPSFSDAANCCPPRRERTAIQSGMDATTTAASPELTHCCPTATRPLPPAKRSAPVDRRRSPRSRVRSGSAAEAEDDVEQPSRREETHRAKPKGSKGLERHRHGEIGRAPNEIHAREREDDPNAGACRGRAIV
jgi:hypothetical protein